MQAYHENENKNENETENLPFQLPDEYKQLIHHFYERLEIDKAKLAKDITANILKDIAKRSSVGNSTKN
jgi:hypothetical protein